MADPPIGSPDWLSFAQRQLKEESSQEAKTQEEREQQLESCAETLHLLVDAIKTILSNHNRQLADVKHLLRAMAKVRAAAALHDHAKLQLLDVSPCFSGRGGGAGRWGGRGL